MQKILRKRILRDLRANLFRYMALGFLIILSMYLIVSMVGAAETVIRNVDQYAKENHLEDGEFTVFVPLSADQEKRLEDAGIALEPMFFIDFERNGKGTVRVFSNREKLNQVRLDEGRLAETPGEAVLEKRYCQEQGIHTGDKIQIGGQTLRITGIGSVPDYDAPYKELTDSSADSEMFGMVFVAEEQYKSLKEGGGERSESCTYAYKRAKGVTDRKVKDLVKEFKIKPEEVDDITFQEYWDRTGGKKENAQGGFTGLNNLTQFVAAEDNPRIHASADDQIINKTGGLIAGVIVLILFAYVISVFVVHNIERESSIIGTLYAMGVKKKELIVHYLTLPTAVSFIAGIIGTAAGFSKFGLNIQMQECYNYFSLPKPAAVYPVYLIIYGVILPPVLVMSVNYLVMNKRLGRSVLSLLNKESKEKRAKNLDLGKMGFIARFRIRQTLRELRSTGTVIFGMFISLLILLLGINCYVMCMHISRQNKEDTKYQYMYTYKYPDKEVPEGGEEAYAVGLTRENLGYQLDVTLLGINDKNPYFDADVAKGENRTVLSSAAAQKFGLKIGDQFVLRGKENDRDYAFTVDDITQYSAAMYVFMDIGSMRDLFGQTDDYYNVVCSDRSLDIPAGKLYAAVSKEQIEKSSDIFVDKMMPMIWMLLIVSALVFGMVMYLMMKVMIDRSSFGISLMKIFGYRHREIKKLYLNGSFYIIAAGAAICLPVAKKVMDSIYPMMVANVACAMDLSYTWQLYLVIYAGILLLYFGISCILSGKLKKVLPAEVLKNRE